LSFKKKKDSMNDTKSQEGECANNSLYKYKMSIRLIQFLKLHAYDLIGIKF